jgi:hypothetical protein
MRDAMSRSSVDRSCASTAWNITGNCINTRMHRNMREMNETGFLFTHDEWN